MVTDEARERVESLYRGVLGRQYHAAKHRADEFAQSVVAEERRRKLQPFVRDDDDVLEYGAGVCTNLRQLRCRSKVGFDLSDAGSEIAGRLGIEFVTELSALEGRRFSVVICHHALEHVPDPLATLGRIREMLTPGGRLILCVPFETFRMYRRYVPGEPNHHLFSWNALTLGNLVHDAGLEVLRSNVSPFGYEQRLAPLAKAGTVAYRAALWLVRRLHPADEVLLVARKPVIG